MIVDLAGSSSPVRHLPGRDFEVVRFVADTNAARCSRILKTSCDPLAHVDEMVEWTNQQLRASGVTD